MFDLIFPLSWFSKASTHNARSAKEPWLLVACTWLADWSAKQLVRLYRQRMQIEESFRDMKSQQFGEGLECSRSRGVGRFTVLVLIVFVDACHVTRYHWRRDQKLR